MTTSRDTDPMAWANSMLDRVRAIARAEVLDEAADIIADRFMPLCVCDDCGNRAEAATVERILYRLRGEAMIIRVEHGLERP